MIEVRDVSHRYAQRDAAGGAWALRGISLKVESGTFVSLLGPSGCGKTTLLRIINGLVRPSLGEVVIDGRRVTGPSADRAMVFQEFNLLPWRSARRNVEMPLEVLGFPAGQRNAISAQRLGQVGLQGFADFYPHQLSGGMKQRVGLARALAVEPAVLLMDEPFSALDPLTAEGLREEVLQLWRDPGLPPEDVVLVTHNIEEALQMADRVIVLGRRPSRVLAGVLVNLPRPRDRKSEAFYQLTDYAYSLITEGATAPTGPASKTGGAALPPGPESR